MRKRNRENAVLALSCAILDSQDRFERVLMLSLTEIWKSSTAPYLTMISLSNRCYVLPYCMFVCIFGWQDISMTITRSPILFFSALRYILHYFYITRTSISIGRLETICFVGDGGLLLRN
jgi:hypothetical protein